MIFSEPRLSLNRENVASKVAVNLHMMVKMYSLILRFEERFFTSTHKSTDQAGRGLTK